MIKLYKRRCLYLSLSNIKMILTYANVLPTNITTDFYCCKPTEKILLISKNLTLNDQTRVYKLIQEIIGEVARCVRSAQTVRLDQEDDSLLLAPFKITFDRHTITHTMLAIGNIYKYQLDLDGNANHKDLDKIEFLLRRMIVDYNCLWRHHQCVVPNEAQQHLRSYASLLEYAVGVLSNFFQLTLAEHQELVTCSSLESDDQMDSEDSDDSYGSVDSDYSIG